MWPYFQHFMSNAPKVLECMAIFLAVILPNGPNEPARWCPRWPDGMNRRSSRLPTTALRTDKPAPAHRSAPEPVSGKVESACKPGSVRLAARQSFLSARRRRLAPATYPGTTRAAPMSPYLVLLRVGFTVPYGVGPVRGALLPHPFTLACALAGHRRSALCCTGRRLTPPRSYLALCPMEPGLSSMRLRATRLSGRLRRIV